MVTSGFKSPFLINVSVAYMPPLSNALMLFKCDTDHRFSTKYHQRLKPQHFLVNASFNAWQTSWPPLVRFEGILMLDGDLDLGPVTGTYYSLFQKEISNIPTVTPTLFT